MIVARAPLRIPIGGGGTDLPSYYARFGGFFIGAAVDKYVYVSVNRPAADELIRLKYSRSEEVQRVEDLQHDLVRETLNALDLRGNLEIASMADSTWSLMKKVPVSALENCWDSVMFPAASTIAPLIACTMPGWSRQISVRIQWVVFALTPQA